MESTMNDFELKEHINKIIGIVNRNNAINKMEELKLEINSKECVKCKKRKKSIFKKIADWSFTNYDKSISILLLIAFCMYCKALTGGF